MRKVLILAPRLDCSFKEGPVPAVEGSPNHPLRTNYLPFYGHLLRRHEEIGDSVTFEKKPLWQFKPHEYILSDYDIVYIPHKQRYQFDLGDKGRYYMQQVIPSIFSIDTYGWGADHSKTPFKNYNGSPSAFNLLSKRIEENKSKFDQKRLIAFEGNKDYVFFPCQLPHDETIKYHSEVSVYEALKETIVACGELQLPLVVKGHPANPGSMAELKELALSFENVLWVENISIHQLLENCMFVSLVNSGVGFEALLHKKPVLAFGNSDYSESNVCVAKTYPKSCTTASTMEYIMKHLVDKLEDKEYHNAVQAWYNEYYDVNNPKTFEKIL
jgi:hypothetical protein